MFGRRMANICLSSGKTWPLEVERRFGAPVQMMQLDHGIFDEAAISVIAVETVHEIGRVAGVGFDVRRFRPNVLVRTFDRAPMWRTRGSLESSRSAMATRRPRSRSRCAMSAARW